MKSYVTERQWRLVGKAWEIREYVRRHPRIIGGGRPRCMKCWRSVQFCFGEDDFAKSKVM